MEWSQDNILVTSSAKASKGNGVNAVLGLLQDLIKFQDRVDSTIESQDIAENKQKLEQFQSRLNESYNSLLEMAKGGVQSVRRDSIEKEPDRQKNPIMVNDNTIQQLP